MLLPLLLNNLIAVGGGDFSGIGEVDFGCEPLPQSTVSVRRAVSTGRGAGFVRSRQIYDRPVRFVSLDWNMAAEGTRQMVLDTYDDTLGGTLQMDYVPKNGEPAYKVRITTQPHVERAQTATTWKIALELEEVL